MKPFDLEVQSRQQLGKAASKRFRNSGLIPAVLYHRHEPSLSALVPTKEFTVLAKKSKTSQIFLLKSSDTALNGKNVLVKEIQQNYTTGRVLHVDFQVLKDNEEIRVRIPVVVKGEAFGVKNDGGILTISAHELELTCLPKNIPESIELDVTELKLGDNIHAADLKLPEGVRFEGDAHATIVSVVAQKALVTETETPAVAAEGAAAADGAAAPAEGAAAAPGAEGAAAKGGDEKAAAPAKGKEGGKEKK